MKKHGLVFIIFNLLFSVITTAHPSNLSEVGISVSVQQELFPVIAKVVAEGKNSQSNTLSTVQWRVRNTAADSVCITVTSEIPDWTSPSISQIYLGPHESKEYCQTPFGRDLLSKHSTIPATIILNAKIEDNIIFAETRKIKIRSADEMIWSLNNPYDMTMLIAAWVTPNDDLVEKVLSNAKEKLYERSLSGYQNPNVMSQVKAIFNSVRNFKVSYVSSTMSFGNVGFTQRVRLPRESITQKSANCIDGTVLFASLFENIGLESMIVLIPGHAFVGVRLAPNSSETLFIETTMVGRRILDSILTLKTTFDAAVEEGSTKYNNALNADPNSVKIIDVKRAREIGIYPLW
ncbi:MAG: hypothetical protein KKA84_07525 [Bacteroidetes bacterium]|nr:hypothetical protein [Bacteroidota bacterium]